MSSDPQWQTAVTSTFGKSAPGKGMLLLMPEYRPDICRTIADRTGAAFFDFRREVMQERKTLAHQVTLEELTETLYEEADKGDVLVFNVESLLAVKPDEKRQAWLTDFTTRKWNNRILLPLAIFQQEILAPESTIDLQDYYFHEQTLISRLAM
jgi:hypothetical protein